MSNGGKRSWNLTRRPRVENPVQRLRQRGELKNEAARPRFAGQDSLPAQQQLHREIADGEAQGCCERPQE
jgi:hypothetical protein